MTPQAPMSRPRGKPIFWNAPIGSRRVARPTTHSDIIPNIATPSSRTMYGTRKLPPPYLPHR